MAVFADDTRPNESSQLGGRAACRVVPGALQDHGAFPGDGVFPYFANFYRCAIGGAVRVGVRHATRVSHSGCVVGITGQSLLILRVLRARELR